MKKVTPLLLVILLLTACGEDDTQTNNNQDFGTIYYELNGTAYNSYAIESRVWQYQIVVHDSLNHNNDFSIYDIDPYITTDVNLPLTLDSTSSLIHLRINRSGLFPDTLFRNVSVTINSIDLLNNHVNFDFNANDAYEKFPDTTINLPSLQITNGSIQW